ncbi:MAG: helix-turn-helix domain containing protein [Akkermansiaceae bacterium]|nr:helix-turn-helix domain containing protein [Akkermansiaceae bacterium]
MARLSAAPIVLNDSEQAALEKLVRRPSTSQQIVLRAKIILRASAGEGHGDIARGLGITKETSRRWRQRWRELDDSELSVSERLEDAARRGAPAKFSIEQLTHLYALACESPDKYERPISHWSARELADELVKQKIVESISARHVARLLDEADLKPHQSGYWLHPPPTPTLKSRSTTSARSTP